MKKITEKKCTYCNQPLGFTPPAYKNGDLICQNCWKVVRYSNVKDKNTEECKEFILKRKERLMKGISYYPTNTHHKFSNGESGKLVRGNSQILSVSQISPLDLATPIQ